MRASPLLNTRPVRFVGALGTRTREYDFGIPEIPVHRVAQLIENTDDFHLLKEHFTTARHSRNQKCLVY